MPGIHAHFQQGQQKDFQRFPEFHGNFEGHQQLPEATNGFKSSASFMNEKYLHFEA